MDTRETVTMGIRAQQRLTVLTHVLAGDLTLADAASYLRLSERHVRRLADGLRGDRGPAVLVLGNQSRVPVNRIDEVRRGSRHDWLEGRGPELTLETGRTSAAR